MTPSYTSLKFTRRMAFGLLPEAMPADPVAWANAQLNTVPTIDILDGKGQLYKGLPSDIKLLRTIPEVMAAYRNNWNVVDQMFALPPDITQGQRRAFARKTSISLTVKWSTGRNCKRACPPPCMARSPCLSAFGISGATT